MRINKKRGKRTVEFMSPSYIVSSASIAGKAEGEGPLNASFDIVLDDDAWGEKTWEKAECKMFEQAVRLAVDKTNLNLSDINCMLGGDLLNQIITANYAARELEIPFLGLYGACSTMAESLLLGGMLIDGGFLDNAVCIASSHFATAERQYRYPLEMGAPAPPTSQRTVTGSGAVVLSYEPLLKQTFNNVRLTGGTIGRVVDLGISDITNMGAAMAPAACDTITAHFNDSNKIITDYDAIITGDLGKFGSEMLLELCMAEGLDIEDRHLDCGNLIFDVVDQKLECGGSGCGCSAVVLSSHLINLLETGAWNKMLFLATGALMSPASNQQGESIPGIAHAVVIERMHNI